MTKKWLFGVAFIAMFTVWDISHAMHYEDFGRYSHKPHSAYTGHILHIKKGDKHAKTKRTYGN